MKKTFLILTVLTTLVNCTFAQTQKSLEVGDKAPEFSALSDDGKTWDVKDYIGKKYIVVYFYPAAMTGGCTKQACAYRDLSSQIKSADAIVVGVSGDNVDGLKIFKKAENINFTLLSDESGTVAAKFGVPTKDGGKITKEIDGQSYDLVRGVTASRWTFIIGKDGKIVYKNEQVNVEKDGEEVLNFIKNI